MFSIGYAASEVDETDEERVARIESEVNSGEHTVDFCNYLAKKDFLYELLHHEKTIEDNAKLGEWLRQELSLFISEFAEDYHG